MPRAELFEALLAEFATNGIGDRSLRDIAASVDTSHRMLIHHFGSREELMLAVVEEIEARQVGVLDNIPTAPADSFEAMWADLRRPELRPFERLFFECYARGAQGEEPFTRLLPSAINGWLKEIKKRDPNPHDAALARLGLATMRGLLLDLVATNDRKAVDAAAARFVELMRVGLDS